MDPRKLAITLTGLGVIINFGGKLTQQRLLLEWFRKMRVKAAQKPPNMASRPMIRRTIMLGGTMLPKALQRRKPGKASRSMAWKT